MAMIRLAYRVKLLFSLLLLFGTAAVYGPAAAQESARIAPKIAPPIWRPPVIWLPPAQEKLQPLSLASVDVDIRVHGHIATTSMELAFYNPNSRVLEGELVFPLGAGQTVSGYALEVNGKMRQAVAVPKEKAREVFESVTRVRVDPGLAELTKGNVFRTRIYPIPASGVKRVMVAFDQELSDTGKGLRYFLPMGYTQKIGRFKVHAEVIKQEIAPVADSIERGEAIAFTHWNDSYVADLSHADYVADRPLAFIVPKQGDAPRSFLARDALEPSQIYFNTSLMPSIPVPPKSARPPRHIAIFYDASGSAAARDRKLEHTVLAAYFKRLGKASVDLVVFRNDADAPRRFEIDGGDSQALLDTLDVLPLDGGTSLGAIDLNMVPDAERVIVVSDGLSNFGGHEIRERIGIAPASLPLYVLHAAQSADDAALARIAGRHGGNVVNLLSWNGRDAVTPLMTAPFQYLGAKVLSGRVRELAPALPTPIARDFTLAGICDGRASQGRCELDVQFGYGGKASVTQRIMLDTTQALPAARGAFVHRLWAQKRIAELELDAKANDARITDLAKDNGLVSRNTSLLVLDRLDDYLRYRIAPPEPELLAQYQERLARMPKVNDDQMNAAHLESVVQRWREFKAWHEKPHPRREAATAANQPAASTSVRALNEDSVQRFAPMAAPAMEPSAPSAARVGGLTKALKKEAEAPELSSTIAIKPWNPDTPYLRKLRAAKDAYEAYLEERKENAASSAFYLDCADFFRDEKKDERLALRVLSNLAEMELENAPLLRILAYRLQQIGRHDLAVPLFEEVLQMRGEEPQSRRDLAIALSRQAKPDYERAARLLWEVVDRQWDGRFPDIEIIALHELNALAESLPESTRPDLAKLGVDPRLIGGIPVELRVVLTWDADNTDIDLHITDPAGETLMYSNPRGKTGGLVSRDFTQGYGPEVFTIKYPLPGTYIVKTNYYGNRQQKLAGATTVQVEFQTGFGTPQQKVQAVTRRLKETRETIEIGSFTVGAK
jgi:tetratricopeptide (TPR) repeat protein